MASITKRKDSYLIRVYVGKDENNKQKFITETYRPQETTPKRIQKEVELYAQTLEKKIQNGEYYSGDHVTFSEFVKIWDQEWASVNLTLAVREQYNRILESRVLRYIGNQKLSKIKATQIQAIFKDMQEEGKIASTIQKVHVVVNSVFKFAYRMDIIPNNPCDRCFIPKIESKTYKDIHFFTVDQAKTFLEAVSSDYESPKKGCVKTINGKEYTCSGYTQTIKQTQPKMWKAYFTLAIYGGFRRGELVALNWGKVNFEKQTILIDQSATKTEAQGQIVKEPKTRGSLREISLPKECFAVLNEWRAEQLRIDFKMGSAWNSFRSLPVEERPVFVQIESGKRIDLSTPTHKFREIIDHYNETAPEDKKLPRIRLHDLRHTSATLLLANNTDIETVSHRLGHSKVSMTLDVYGHWVEENDKTASETLSRLFG